MNLVIKNGMILDEDGNRIKRDIYIEGGVISQIAESISVDFTGVVDAEGFDVLPGFIDLNCRIGDPGYENVEDIDSVSRSAAKGGFTSLTCLPTTKPMIDDKTVVQYIISKSKKQAKVNIFPYGNMTKGGLGKEIAEIGEMHKAGVVGISDGNHSVFDADLLRNILSYSGMFNIPVITFCENKLLAGNGVMNKGMVSTKIGLAGTPREAEETFIARNLILAMHNNSRLHITHVSTKGAVDWIRFAKQQNVRVTCDTCPHYFTLSEEAVNGYNTFAKVTPPLRTQEDIEAIKAGLADHTIDAIASGHSPTAIESKQIEFDRAVAGISSLETVYGLCYTALVESGILSLTQLVQKLSYMPSHILGLDSKGALLEGMDADLIVVDNKERYVVNPLEFASKAKFSPHAGAEVRGRVQYTIVGGTVVYLR